MIYCHLLEVFLFFSFLFCSPCAVTENILATEGVDRHVILHSAIGEDGVPIVEQHLILREMRRHDLAPKSCDD